MIFILFMYPDDICPKFFFIYLFNYKRNLLRKIPVNEVRLCVNVSFHGKYMGMKLNGICVKSRVGTEKIIAYTK